MHKLKGSRNKEAASPQGEAEGLVDPEDLELLVVSPCAAHRDTEKRGQRRSIRRLWVFLGQA